MRPEKKQIVQDIRALIEPSPAIFLITYRGLSADAFGQLRKELEAAGAECHVVPNRLLKIAAGELNMTPLEKAELNGDTAMVSGGEDSVAVARVIRDFGKKNEAVTFKLAMVEGNLCDAREAARFADMPPKEVLQAQLLGLLQAPAGQLARVLQAKVASIAYVLSAYLGEKEKAA